VRNFSPIAKPLHKFTGRNVAHVWEKEQDEDLKKLKLIPCQIKTGHNPTPSEFNDFCQIVVPMERSIPAKFYCLKGTRVLTADIQICQKSSFFGTCHLRKSGITSALIEI
jgi:hypothetical protein